MSCATIFHIVCSTIQTKFISLFRYCSDDLLSLPEFMLICRALFRNDKGHIYIVPDERIERIFEVFDKNGDGFIDRNEFQFCWNHWIKTVNINLTIVLELTKN